MKYIWCEDSGAGFEFWREIFQIIHPEIKVESKQSNGKLLKAVSKINDDNTYYILLDVAIDNPDVLREYNRLFKYAEEQENIKIIKIHSFEFTLLSFSLLDNWVFARNDELKEKREEILTARDMFVKLILDEGSLEDLRQFRAIFNYADRYNTERISAKLLYEITRNTGFETNKGKLGPCFINSCCEWEGRHNDDICGLDDDRLSADSKKRMLVEYSALKNTLNEVNL